MPVMDFKIGSIAIGIRDKIKIISMACGSRNSSDSGSCRRRRILSDLEVGQDLSRVYKRHG